MSYPYPDNYKTCRPYSAKPGEEFFIVPSDDKPGKYDLMFGDPDTAIGFQQASGDTIKNLLTELGADDKCFRVYLARVERARPKKQIKFGGHKQIMETLLAK